MGLAHPRVGVIFERMESSSSGEGRRGMSLEPLSEVVVILSSSLSGSVARCEDGVERLIPSLEVARGSSPPSGTTVLVNS